MQRVTPSRNLTATVTQKGRVTFGGHRRFSPRFSGIPQRERLRRSKEFTRDDQSFSIRNLAATLVSAQRRLFILSCFHDMPLVFAAGAGPPITRVRCGRVRRRRRLRPVPRRDIRRDHGALRVLVVRRRQVLAPGGVGLHGLRRRNLRVGGRRCVLCTVREGDLRGEHRGRRLRQLPPGHPTASNGSDDVRRLQSRLHLRPDAVARDHAHARPDCAAQGAAHASANRLR